MERVRVNRPDGDRGGIVGLPAKTTEQSRASAAGHTAGQPSETLRLQKLIPVTCKAC